MTVEDVKTGKALEDYYTEMAKTWKNGYLKGLDASLQWQEEIGRLLNDSVRQGIAGSRQWLSLWKDWIDDQTQEQRGAPDQINSSPNAFWGLTKQSAEAVLITFAPLLKNSEAAVESSFGYYETALAAPSRKYVRQINKQVLDVIIPI